MALAGVRAWAEYEADTDADDAGICLPTRTLMALLEVRECWRCLFGDQSQGRAVTQVTVEHSEDREDQPTTPLPGVLPPALSQQFFRRTPAAKAICTGPLANLELPTVEQLAEAIAVTISQRINTPPELQHAQWLTDTMTAAGVDMHQHHTEPTLLRVGDNNLCAISLGQEDEEFADTLRLAVARTSHVALLRAIRLRTIVIYLTESEFDPSELLIHPFSQTVRREAGGLGGNTGHNQIRRAAIGMREKARKPTPKSLALRAAGRPVCTLTLQLTAHHHIIIGGTRGTDRTDHWRKTVSTACGKIKAALAPAPAIAPAATVMHGAQADDEEELELNYEDNNGAMEVNTDQQRLAELHHLTTAATKLLAQSSPASQPAIAAELANLAAETHQLRNPQRLSIQLERHPSQPTPACKGKAATTA
eukprot:jgi/Tetstr1/427312/TSEL_017481.t1